MVSILCIRWKKGACFILNRLKPPMKIPKESKMCDDLCCDVRVFKYIDDVHGTEYFWCPKCKKKVSENDVHRTTCHWCGIDRYLNGGIWHGNGRWFCSKRCLNSHDNSLFENIDTRE